MIVPRLFHDCSTIVDDSKLPAVPGLRGTTRKDARLCLVVHGFRIETGRTFQSCFVWLTMSLLIASFYSIVFSDLVQASVLKWKWLEKQEVGL